MEDHFWIKAVLHTKALQHTHMSHCEAHVLYWSCSLLAILYPLPATWLPATFLEWVMHLSTPTSLNKMGLHCNLPWSVVFVPHALDDIGFCNLTHEHTVQQLITLIWHLRKQTPLGQAMETLIQTYQLWAGQHNQTLRILHPACGYPTISCLTYGHQCTNTIFMLHMMLGSSLLYVNMTGSSRIISWTMASLASNSNASTLVVCTYK